ncbi:MAG: hypothetical protein GY754_29240 [bacterium]|nr:hypothetical protein [bacterium]
MKRIKLFWMLSITFLLSFSITAQDSEEYWVKYSPEVRLDFIKPKIEIRFRPYDYITPFNVGRMDLMVGKPFMNGMWKVFSYSKFDTAERMWTGIRLDNNTHFLKNKLNVHLQYRHFFGLNPASQDEQYFIQLINYSVNPLFQPGFFGFAKKKESEELLQSYWFMGPSVISKINKSFSTILAFSKDVMGNRDYYIFLRLNYRIKLG